MKAIRLFLSFSLGMIWVGITHAQSASYNIDTQQLHLPVVEIVSEGLVIDHVEVEMVAENTPPRFLLTFSLTKMTPIEIEATDEPISVVAATYNTDTEWLYIPVLEIMSGDSVLERFAVEMQVQVQRETQITLLLNRVIRLTEQGNQILVPSGTNDVEIIPAMIEFRVLNDQQVADGHSEL